MKSTIYVLAERDRSIKLIDSYWLLNYLHYGQSIYHSAKDAEEGRQAGDAYDDPGKTRAVGIELKSFLPSRKKKKSGVTYLCRKCGHKLSRKNVSPGYKFYCPNCDEDMYGIEAIEVR